MIGEVLEISSRTIEIRRACVLYAMGAQRTSEAIRVAIDASLASQPRATIRRPASSLSPAIVLHTGRGPGSEPGAPANFSAIGG